LSSITKPKLLITNTYQRAQLQFGIGSGVKKEGRVWENNKGRRERCKDEGGGERREGDRGGRKEGDD